MDLAELETKLAQRPHSPLFARVADQYLALNRFDEAEDLCRSGLQQYLHYCSAKVVLAKCCAAKNQFGPAIELLREVLIVYPGCVALESLLARWETQKKPELPAAETETNAVDEESRVAEVKQSRGIVDDGRIVTGTLAEIYVEQNQFAEAIRTYELLKKQKPDRIAEIEERIKQLEVKLQTRPAEAGNPLISEK